MEKIKNKDWIKDWDKRQFKILFSLKREKEESEKEKMYKELDELKKEYIKKLMDTYIWTNH